MSDERSWKAELIGRLPEAWEREIDVYESQLQLKIRGKLDDKLFAETRLRRGAYGQRYDNGQRHDGTETQALSFPCGGLAKGPGTVWDAPGMQRIKIPFGKLSAQQLDVLCELAEEYSDQILHVTTRQDIQLHFVHIEDTPNIMRRLAAVGITTREACGNSVRNVTACPIAGVCHDEAFDVGPYARALTFFLLGHPDTQDMGRKFKVSFSGCSDHACGLSSFHDIGLIARTRLVGDKLVRGFEFHVGGGLGPVPQAAQLLQEFVTDAELLPLAQSVCRVFARLGERENRSRARMKFLVKKLGLEEFRSLVMAERERLRPDPRWTSFLEDLSRTEEKPIREPGELRVDQNDPKFVEWVSSNVYPQRQSGYSAVTVKLPLGDFTPSQGRVIADLMRKYTGDTLRTTVEQNLLMRWVSNSDVAELYKELCSIGLGEAGASRISDVTACPGTDTCKLGISSSRGLAAELRRHLTVAEEGLSPEAKGLHIKCSGCFNSCGQHHVADIGFLGVSRSVNGRRVPHFQLVVGGQWENNAGAFGLAIGAIPSKKVPEAVKRLTEAYSRDRKADEIFQDWIKRIGKKSVKAMVSDLTEVPRFEDDPSYYQDWGDPRVYTTGDMGVGECAGEIVSPIEFGLAESERRVFEAQLLLDAGDARAAADRALSAMIEAARSLTTEHNPELGQQPDEIVGEFRRHLYDTQRFYDPFMGGKFAHYLFRAHSSASEVATHEGAHQLVEEAQLFIDAAHQYYARRTSAPS